MWWFRFALAMHGNDTFIGREFLRPISGGYTARLIVGADEGDARTFDVRFSWQAQAATPEQALGSLLLSVEPV